MALLLKKVYQGYFWLFNDLSDPRVDNVFLSSPLVAASIVGCYLYFVYNLGPKLMEKRKPFDLKKVLIAYNLTQILFNAGIVIFGLKAILNMDWNCAVLDRSDSPNAKLQLRLAVAFYLLKLYDLLDTIFFVLRKSTRQISFLHVYHHAGMASGTFVVMNFTGGGELIWTGFINAIVHSIMFSYYLLSVIDKKWQKNLQLKKFLTQLQLTQFVLNILIYGRLLFKSDCAFPKIVPLWYVPQNIFMVVLFGDFYLRTYVRKNKNK